MVTIFFPFQNNGTNSCPLLTEGLTDGFVAHPSLVQVYSLVPDVLWQLSGVARGDGEVGMEESDHVDGCALYIRVEIKRICN